MRGQTDDQADFRPTGCFAPENGHRHSGVFVTTLLHIDSSPLGDASVTRRLTREFVRGWCEAHPATDVLRRDLQDPPPPHLDESALAAFWNP